jgi:hypothetical protein
MGWIFGRLLLCTLAALVAVNPAAEDSPPMVEKRDDIGTERFRGGRETKLIQSWEAQERRGLYLYGSESYDRAYELLSDPARRGYKGAQHAMALMHIKGESVEKNVLIGTALMGLAAESGDRQLKRDYANLLQSVAKKYRSLVEAQVSYYIARYGMQAQGIHCAIPDPSVSVKLECWKEPGDYTEYPWKP